MTDVTCIITTSPENIPTKAVAVKNTWAQNCTHTLYIYQKSDTNMDVHQSKVPNAYPVSDLGSFEYLHVINKTTSWYLIADDSSYVSYIRLNKYLMSVPAQEFLRPIYIGNSLNASRDSLGPYVLNLHMITKIQSEYTDLAEAKEVQSLKNVVNATLKDMESFAIENPITAHPTQQV